MFLEDIRLNWSSPPLPSPSPPILRWYQILSLWFTAEQQSEQIEFNIVYLLYLTSLLFYLTRIVIYGENAEAFTYVFFPNAQGNFK